MKSVLILLLPFLLGSCTSMYSIKGMKANANKDYDTINNEIKKAKGIYVSYKDAYKSLKATNAIPSKATKKKMRASLKVMRIQAKQMVKIKRSINDDLKALELATNETDNVSEGSVTYEKVKHLVPKYTGTEESLEIKLASETFHKAADNFQASIEEHSGYITDNKTLRDQLLDGVGSLEKELAPLTEGESPNEDAKSLLVEVANLKSIVNQELPEKLKSIIMTPRMRSFSMMDNVQALYKEVVKLKKASK